MLNRELPASSLSTSLSLLHRVVSRDTEAWERFAKIYGPLVYSWARRAGLQDSDSSDLTQEVFVLLAEKLSRFDRLRANAGFRGWLWGVVRNRIREFYRRQATTPDPQSALFLENVPWQANNSSPAEVDDDTVGVAKRALEIIRADFSAQTWEIFWRLTMVGEKPKDVAAAMNLNVASVYTAKSRVLSHLRGELSGLLD